MPREKNNKEKRMKPNGISITSESLNLLSKNSIATVEISVEISNVIIIVKTIFLFILNERVTYGAHGQVLFGLIYIIFHTHQ